MSLRHGRSAAKRQPALAVACEFCHNPNMAHLTGQERAQYVQNMFGRIADRYDRMNRLMTFGQDVTWRRYVIDKANVPPNGRLLDIATGTGDIAFEGWARNPTIQTVGTDFSYEMMDAGRRTYPERRVIDWADSDALALPFPENHFDAVTSGFLIRNVIDAEKSLSEQLRVLKPAGTVVVLESSPPKDNLLKPFIKIHLNYVIPLIGRIVTGQSDAYQYLPSSTQKFQTPNALANTMRRVGFVGVGYRMFMFGTIAVHFGRKPLD